MQCSKNSHQTERDAVDGLLVLYDHVEAELVVHDGPEAHDAHVDVVGGVAHPQLGRVPQQLGDPRALHLQPRAAVARRSLVRRGGGGLATDGADDGGGGGGLLAAVAVGGDVAGVVGVHGVAHDDEAAAEVVHQDVEPAVLGREELADPLDVVGAEGDFEVTQDLKNNSGLLKNRVKTP